MAAGEGMVRAHHRTTLVQHGGHIQITKAWAMSLLQRMGFVKRKATTKSTSGLSGEQIEVVRKSFLKQVARMVKLRDIPDSLIINLDQTGMKLVPTGDWTMAAVGSRRVEVIGLGDKRQITVTFAAAQDGTFYQCRSCTRERPTVHTQTTHVHYLTDSTSSTHPITGLMRKRVFASSKTSSSRTLRKCAKKLV